jgi:spore coat-associated protein N
VKKIVFMVISALIVLATIGVGTWAYFSDTQASTGNVFTAGTLDLGLANAASGTQTGDTTATFNSTSMKPGDTVTGDLYINNNGTIDGQTLKVTFNYTSVDTNLRPTTISGSPWSLSTDAFDQMITATTATYGGTAVPAIAGKTLAQLKAAAAIVLPNPGANSVPLPHNAENALHIVFTFSSTATNGCQGNTITVSVTVNAYQQAGA